MSLTTFPLSIVIPAYKPDFLQKALQSIEDQTDKRFQVFIGDDASSSDLRAIAQPFLKRNGWEYFRFSKNLGNNNLVQHWNRCVELSSSQWVWLFSDDDKMSPDCVQTFYAELEKGHRANVLRFNLQIINENGDIIDQNLPTPKQVSAFELGKLRFTRQLLSSAVEYIFHRDSFEKEGGFVNFPFAWCSDDASWVAFARDLPIYTLPSGLVSWRMSKVNISSRGDFYPKKKIEASIQFINWFNSRFPDQLDNVFRSEQLIWLRLQMVNLAFQPGFFETLLTLRKLKIPLSVNLLRAFDDLYCLSYVYWKKVIRNETPSGLRYWLHFILPKY